MASHITKSFAETIFRAHAWVQDRCPSIERHRGMHAPAEVFQDEAGGRAKMKRRGENPDLISRENGP
jgi:hypothetical protein